MTESQGKSAGDGRPTEASCEPWLKQLEGPDPAVRSRAAWALWKSEVRGPVVVAGLLKAIEDADASVRYYCALALSECSDDFTVAFRLAKAFDREQDVRVAYACIHGLGRSSSRAPEVMAALVKAGHNDDLTLVKEAVAGLSRSPEPAAVEFLCDCLLRHRDRGVRIQAARSLGRFLRPGGTERVLSPDICAALGAALAADPDAEVRYWSAASLGWGQCGPNAVAVLSRALRGDASPIVRRRAAWSLGRVGGPAAVAALREVAGDPADRVLRYVAGRALRRFGLSTREAPAPPQAASASGEAPVAHDEMAAGPDAWHWFAGEGREAIPLSAEDFALGRGVGEWRLISRPAEAFAFSSGQGIPPPLGLAIDFAQGARLHLVVVPGRIASSHRDLWALKFELEAGASVGRVVVEVLEGKRSHGARTLLAGRPAEFQVDPPAAGYRLLLAWSGAGGKEHETEVRLPLRVAAAGGRGHA